MMHIDVFKLTQEDWYGSYRIADWYNGVEGQMLVKVSFLGNISPPGQAPTWRTCVWGNDDCGMEFDSDSEAVAYNIFLQTIGMEYVNRSELTKLGFVSA